MLTLAQQVEDLFAEYWDIAYNEGHLQRPDGDKANVVLHKLRALLQPPAVSAEPVAWIRRHPSGELTTEILPDPFIEEVRRASGAWLPLYISTPPSAAAQKVVAQLTEDEFLALAETVDDGSGEQMFVDTDGWLRALYKAMANGEQQ